MKRTTNPCRRLTAAAGAAALLFASSATLAGQPGDCPPFDFLFSLDIGSDTELSDPFMDGDEFFDPGDAYVGGILLGGPANGFIDDALFFGIDPPPVPGGFGTAAPTCTGASIPNIIPEYFDLDGIDIIDQQIDLPPDTPLQTPYPYQGSPCFFPAENLRLSFDDDVAAHYADPGCPVPVASPSPFTGSIFGTTGGMDEVVSVAVSTLVPTPVGPIMPLFDERLVSPSMAPNPDNGEQDDDDVDALDFVMAPIDQLTLCPFVYWSPDHEATGPGLDPGDIYLSMLFGPPGAIPAIDDVAHLGIPDSTDVDAFEFVAAESVDGIPGLFVALIFSVDDDDPLTPGDESGGLDPSVIYISYFTGFSVPFTPPLGEDVDAITNYCADQQPNTGACCFCDGSCADVPTAADCAALGGVFHGIGTTCATIMCEPYGACCYCDGVCADNITASACLSTGGTFHPCLTCAEILCEPTGACCLCDGTCVDNVTFAVCTDPLALNGKWQGPCSTCIAGQCEPYGACCLPDGTCVDMLSKLACEGAAFGGVYQGDCTDCSSVDCPPVGEEGACCFGCETYPGGPGFTCVDTDRDTCCDILKGHWIGAGTSCATISCTQSVCIADMDGDNDVDVFDFNKFAPNFGKTFPTICGHCDGDFNCDGRVDVFDFNILAPNFGCSLPPLPDPCCTP